ncbi:MAG: FkbM family methyltransferase [Phycisphaerales bacterium]|nr:MAG: FkbM family methyltransferase [Phycisphaerales bacterium]
MRIGAFRHGWWKRACETLSLDVTDLPVAEHPSGNAYAADLNARIANGSKTAAVLADLDVDLLLDNGGTGLGFLRVAEGADNLKLVHEEAGRPLLSHFIDPLATALQGLPWPAVWQCLQSQSWGKAIWDRAQAVELQRLGVPGVTHLPMAAQDRSYDTRPLHPSKCMPLVSFVGSQNTSYFARNVTVPTNTLLAGTLARATRCDLPDMSFYDIYHDVYGLGEPVDPGDLVETKINKTLAYFNAKLFYNASLCIHNRDRFVIFLKRILGDTFHLVGRGWDTAYGLRTSPRLATADEYLNHFREAAINLNLVNGNAETGLNMRHFEITAAGGFMLCYRQPELKEHFEIGKECVEFDNEADLLEKIQYYLSHPQERVAIALAGQKRTLSQHLYSHRLQALLQAVQPKPLPVEYSTTNRWDDLKSLVPDPEVVLDCGANTGQTASSLRKIYPGARIYSFEPVTSVFGELRTRCEALGVHPVKKAVGDRDGMATIHLTASPEANSLLGFQEGSPCSQWCRVVGCEDVEVCTLDRWCVENGIDLRSVDILKLDVQGAELQALYGARKLLKTVKAVYLEVSFVPIYKDCPLFDEIETFMKECGYRRQTIYPSDQPHNWADALYVKA